jgi:hypothetical protein
MLAGGKLLFLVLRSLRDASIEVTAWSTSALLIGKTTQKTGCRHHFNAPDMKMRRRDTTHYNSPHAIFSSNTFPLHSTSFYFLGVLRDLSQKPRISFQPESMHHNSLEPNVSRFGNPLIRCCSSLSGHVSRKYRDVSVCS